MPQRKIPQDELINFIVKVRYFSSQTTDTRRWLGQIKNLANHMYRSYIGYTARGEYRIKAKGEHVFADDVARKGEDSPLRALAVENDRLRALADQMEAIKAERAEFERRKREVDERAKEAADAAHAERLRLGSGFEDLSAAPSEADVAEPEDGFEDLESVSDEADVIEPAGGSEDLAAAPSEADVAEPEDGSEDLESVSYEADVVEPEDDSESPAKAETGVVPGKE